MMFYLQHEGLNSSFVQAVYTPINHRATFPDLNHEPNQSIGENPKTNLRALREA